MDMRDLRKVDVKRAVYFVPHNYRESANADNSHASTPLRVEFRGQPVCVAFISRSNAGPEGSRAIARIGYHRNVGGGAARIPFHP